MAMVTCCRSPRTPPRGPAGDQAPAQLFVTEDRADRFARTARAVAGLYPAAAMNSPNDHAFVCEVGSLAGPAPPPQSVVPEV